MSYKEEIMTLSTIHPNMTNSEIAQLVGCSRALVHSYRKDKRVGKCKHCGEPMEVSTREFCSDKCRPSQQIKIDTKAEALKRYNKFKETL